MSGRNRASLSRAACGMGITLFCTGKVPLVSWFGLGASIAFARRSCGPVTSSVGRHLTGCLINNQSQVLIVAMSILFVSISVHGECPRIDIRGEYPKLYKGQAVGCINAEEYFQAKINEIYASHPELKQQVENGLNKWEENVHFPLLNLVNCPECRKGVIVTLRVTHSRRYEVPLGPVDSTDCQYIWKEDWQSEPDQFASKQYYSHETDCPSPKQELTFSMWHPCCDVLPPGFVCAAGFDVALIDRDGVKKCPGFSDSKKE